MKGDVTIREVEVIQLLADGNTFQEIGKSLFISEWTVDNHITRIKKKLHCKTLAQVVSVAYKKNLLNTMERRTRTTLGEMRIGDRFVYLTLFGNNRTDPWQVMARADKKGKVAVNQIGANKKPVHRYDELKKSGTQVLFLRHTIPVPGEECFVEDLEPGNVFFKPDDVINEYVVTEKGVDFYTVRKCSASVAIEKAGRLATVVFVRDKQ